MYIILGVCTTDITVLYMWVLSCFLIACCILVGAAVSTSGLIYFHLASKYCTDVHG